MRFSYHFEPARGWMNDPNGLCFYQGRYHAFFQHNPYAPKWDRMHWGHAVSEDLLTWKELPIALSPDLDYENTGGCFSGSAIEKDGKLHLFYTAVSDKYGQAQATAVSVDGIHFEKSKENPILPYSPHRSAGTDNGDFRDPRVFYSHGAYHMVVGAAEGGVGRVLLYSSPDLASWHYDGIAYETDAYGGTLECPDLYPLGDKWVLMFSAMKPTVASSVFVIGNYDGTHFYPERETYSEYGRDFYAPQTLLSEDGRRIMIGWFYRWGKPLPAGATVAGALSIPRELSLRNGYVLNYPVREARHLLRDTCPYVTVSGTTVTVKGLDGEAVLTRDFSGVNGIERIERAEVLFDCKAVEVFLNGGAASVSCWLI